MVEGNAMQQPTTQALKSNETGRSRQQVDLTTGVVRTCSLYTVGTTPLARGLIRGDVVDPTSFAARCLVHLVWVGSGTAVPSILALLQPGVLLHLAGSSGGAVVSGSDASLFGAWL